MDFWFFQRRTAQSNWDQTVGFGVILNRFRLRVVVNRASRPRHDISEMAHGCRNVPTSISAFGAFRLLMQSMKLRACPRRKHARPKRQFYQANLSPNWI
jgi:hypothetical protein